MRTFTTGIAGLLLFALASTSSTAWADRDRDRGWGHRKHDHDRANVSINVNVSPPGYLRDYSYRPYRSSFDSRRASFNNWRYGVGVGSYGSQFFINGWNNPWVGWSDSWSRRDFYDRRPVIVEKNIYIQHATPERRVTTRAVTTSTTSLFRDRHGRCYEREVDGFGNETRVEIDPAECNF